MRRTWIPDLRGPILATLLAAAWIWPIGPATAATPGSTPTQAQCPQGQNVADGCSNAPLAGSFLVGAFATYARQSGQGWVGNHPWPWNAAGVDYPVGYSTTAPLQDPATATLPGGCVYQPTGTSSGGPRVYCNTYNGRGVANPVIQNIDFSLHGCTILELTSNVTGTVTIVNNKFQNGAACNVANGYLVKLVGGHASFVFNYNQIDGNSPQYVASFVSDIVDNSPDGSVTLMYNAVLNSPEIPITTPTIGSVTVSYNYIDGWVLNPVVTEHGGVLMQGPPAYASIPATNYTFNTAVTPAISTPSSGTATFTLSAHPGRHVMFASATIDHNVVVTNLAGGASGTVSVSAALAYMNWALYGTVTITNNYVDPSGALSCVQNIGGAYSVVGHVNGNTLTVTRVGTGALYPGAIFRTAYTGPGSQVIQPYGTIDPRTGAPSTGTGLAGTYVLSGSPQTVSFTLGNTMTSPIGNLTEGGNVSLVSGSPIVGTGGPQNGATCPPLF